tara:strand:- start:594 stop:803 length:210 start_codon:yes stop_codon:yes gene_type:complete
LRYERGRVEAVVTFRTISERNALTLACCVLAQQDIAWISIKGANNENTAATLWDSEAAKIDNPISPSVA